jgi:hypothetical protein
MQQQTRRVYSQNEEKKRNATPVSDAAFLVEALPNPTPTPCYNSPMETPGIEPGLLENDQVHLIQYA